MPALPDWDPHLVLQLLFGVLQTGSEVKPVGIDPSVDLFPWGWRALSPDKREILKGLAVSQMASMINDPAARRQVEDAGLGMIAKALREIQSPSPS